MQRSQTRGVRGGGPLVNDFGAGRLPAFDAAPGPRDQPGHVLPDTRHDRSRQDEHTLTRIRLWQAGGELAAAQLSHLPNDTNRACVQEDQQSHHGYGKTLAEAGQG